MKIGKVIISSKLALTPMAGVTDLGFRTVRREPGAGYTVTEMANAKAPCYQNKKSLSLLELGGGKHPAAVQLFGSDPYCMEQAAGIAAEKLGADVLDINIGCLVPRVANSGDGSGLMRDPELAVKVTEAVIRGAGERPVTVRFWLDWDRDSVSCVEFTQTMEAADVAAVAIHGRTKMQMYSSRVNWDYIRTVKGVVSIPVLASGDVFEPEDAVHTPKYTGADMVMFSRDCFDNPWLFARAQAALGGRPVPPLPSLARWCGTTVWQFRLSAAQKGEHIACLKARKHYTWYLKGVPYVGYYKGRISKISALEDTGRIITGIQWDLRD